MTYFASMGEAVCKGDPGPDVKLMGRWHNQGDCTGTFVCEAKSATALYEWYIKWSADTMATMKASPILTDDSCRIVILGRTPTFSMSLKDLADTPREEETLFKGTWKVYPESKMKAYQQFAAMPLQDETNDRGNCRYLGRFHDLGTGTGFVIAAAVDEMDLHSWGYHWTTLIDIHWEAVIDTFRDIVKSKSGSDAKLSPLMEKMKTVL
jgi:hypothetical protein